MHWWRDDIIANIQRLKLSCDISDHKSSWPGVSNFDLGSACHMQTIVSHWPPIGKTLQLPA